MQSSLLPGTCDIMVMIDLVGWPALVHFQLFLDAGMQSMGPAVQYLAGELSVEQGTVLPLLASHNTVRMRFDIEQAEYLHQAKPDAAFPPVHFAMLADRGRNQVDFDLLMVGSVIHSKLQNCQH